MNVFEVEHIHYTASLTAHAHYTLDVYEDVCIVIGCTGLANGCEPVSTHVDAVGRSAELCRRL